MNRARKVIITLIVNLILLGIIIFSSYMMVTQELTEIKKNVFSLMIIVCIPLIFLVTFINTSWEKYDNIRPGDKDDEEALTQSLDQSETSVINKTSEINETREINKTSEINEKISEKNEKE